MPRRDAEITCGFQQWKQLTHFHFWLSLRDEVSIISCPTIAQVSRTVPFQSRGQSTLCPFRAEVSLLTAPSEQRSVYSLPLQSWDQSIHCPFRAEVSLLTGMLEILVMGSIFSGTPMLTSGIHRAQLTWAHFVPLLKTTRMKRHSTDVTHTHNRGTTETGIIYNKLSLGMKVNTTSKNSKVHAPQCFKSLTSGTPGDMGT